MVKVEIEEEQETLYDERMAFRKIAYRNVDPNPNWTILQADQSVESIISSGVPSWLVGSVHLLVPCVFDLRYWDSHLTWVGKIKTELNRKSIPRPEDSLKMLVHLEFLDNGQVQMRSNLISDLALEEWRKAKSDPDKLDETKMIQVLGSRRRRPWLLVRNNQRKVDPSAAVIQGAIKNYFPMGPYRGNDNRLVLHQTGCQLIKIVDPLSLIPKQLVSYADFDPSFKGIPCQNSKFDPISKEMFNVLLDYHKGTLCRYNIVSMYYGTNSSNLQESCTRPVATFLAPPTKLEFFAITSSHIIIPITPNQYRGKLPNFEANIVEGVDDLLSFKGDEDTLFHVISRSLGRLVCVYKSEACHIENVLNAFEEGDSIYIDLVASDTPFGRITMENIQCQRMEELSNVSLPNCTLRRYCLFKLGEESARFDGAAGQLPTFPPAVFHHLTDYPLLYAQVVQSVVGSSYRYCYGIGLDRDSRGKLGYPLGNAIIKCDLTFPAKSMQWHRHGCFPGIPVFISKPELAYVGTPFQRTLQIGSAGMNEDDGVLVTIVLDVYSQKSFLLVLDTKDLRELARFIIPKALPPTTCDPVWTPSKLMLLPAPSLVVEPHEKTAIITGS